MASLEEIRAGGYRRSDDVANLKTPRERVAMTSPTGRFTVFVSTSRAAALAGRGYTPTTTAATEPAAPTRAELSERAKALGVPVKGTNAALAEAIAAAEARKD
jgi:hypothetical protein